MPHRWYSPDTHGTDPSRTEAPNLTCAERRLQSCGGCQTQSSTATATTSSHALSLAPAGYLPPTRTPTRTHHHGSSGNHTKNKHQSDVLSDRRLAEQYQLELADFAARRGSSTRTCTPSTGHAVDMCSNLGQSCRDDDVMIVAAVGDIGRTHNRRVVFRKGMGEAYHRLDDEPSQRRGAQWGRWKETRERDAARRPLPSRKRAI